MEDKNKIEGIIKASNPEDYKKLPGSFWVITSYYNPEDIKDKRENYLFFKKTLKKQGVNLITVECAFKKQDFNLNKEDADILLQVRSNSILWQKERLLNIGLENLPDDCDKIAWLDADIIILDDDWAKKVAILLEKYPIVKPFAEAIRLTKKESKKILKGENEELNNLFSYRNRVINNYYQPSTMWKLIFLAVFGMCARREVYEKSGFYDRMIICSGDMVMANAFLYKDSRAKDLKERFHLSEALIVDIDEWYAKLSPRRGDFGICYLEGVTMFHIFHGKMMNRKYEQTCKLLDKYEFNPKKDLIINEDGCYDWASSKPKLHEGLINYFHARNEDDRLITNLKTFTIIFLKKIRIKLYFFALIRRILGLTGKLIKFFSPRAYNYLKKLNNR